MTDLAQLENEILADIAAAGDDGALEAVRVAALGKAGTVTALLKTNPFPDDPPTYIRARFYEYTYASPEEKARGVWWDRRFLGLYFPVVHLNRE